MDAVIEELQRLRDRCTDNPYSVAALDEAISALQKPHDEDCMRCPLFKANRIIKHLKEE